MSFRALETMDPADEKQVRAQRILFIIKYEWKHNPYLLPDRTNCLAVQP